MRIRWFMCLCAIITLGGAALALVQETDSSELLKTADEMIGITARLRGLQPKAPISRGIKTRAEISQYLNEQVRANYNEGELQAEGNMLRVLGLIPAGIDYKAFVLKLYTEQVGGCYDPEKKMFFIASWLSAAEQKPVMVHELTHALQDQYFDLNKMLKEERQLDNDDRALASQALREGDGMSVMLNYLLEPAKRNFSQLPDLSFVMQSQRAIMQSQFPVFESAPAYIQETLLFPYGYGTAFLQKTWLQNPSWEAVNKIYSNPPSSTEQIIHPEKYFGTRDEPQAVSAENFAAKLPSWKIAYKNVLGEFQLTLLLSLHVTEERAKRSAAGWDGDQVLLLENAAGKNAVLVNTVWDGIEEADEFFQAMEVWFQQGFPKARKSGEPGTGFSLIQDGNVNSLRQEGTNVRFAIGLPEAEYSKLGF
jgi:hypothetical protein